MEEIVILHTNDLHSHLEKWPKTRRFLLKRRAELEDAGKTVITLDLGDFSDRVHPLTEATDGIASTALMNQINYDVATIGNNEGIGNSKFQLNQLYNEANFEVILANLFDPQTNKIPKWAQPYKIITTLAGTRLCLIALTAPFPLTYEPNGWDIAFTDQILPELLKEVASKSDLIVLMSHLGIDEETRIAKKYPEINVILGSHTHHLLPKGLKVSACLLAAAGKFGRYVGEVSLRLEDHQLIKSQASVQATSNLAACVTDSYEVENYLIRGNNLLEQRIVGFLPTTYYHQCQVENPMLVELGLAALSQQTGIEVSLLNTGLFLTDLKAGNVTEKDLHECLPHPMHLLKVTLDGAGIKQLVGNINQQANELRNRPIIGMGFRGKVFGELKSQGLAWSEDLSEITWLGNPLSLTKDYTFVTVDHLLFIPFFPIIAEKAKVEVLFPDFLRTVMAKYLTDSYPLV